MEIDRGTMTQPRLRRKVPEYVKEDGISGRAEDRRGLCVRGRARGGRAGGDRHLADELFHLVATVPNPCGGARPRRHPTATRSVCGANPHGVGPPAHDGRRRACRPARRAGHCRSATDRAT